MNTKIASIIEAFFIWGVAGAVMFSLFGAMQIAQGSSLPENDLALESSFVVIQDNSVSSDIEHYNSTFIEKDREEKIRVTITAYSSCPHETDSDPFITASGNWVQDGIVAANFLPFGTELKIPELYGNKIFVVQDRMHPRKKYQIDIWFSTKQEAVEFGAHYTDIELVEEA